MDAPGEEDGPSWEGNPQHMPVLGERFAHRLETARRWLVTEAAPWLTDRRRRVTHGSLLVIGVFALVMAVAGVGRGQVDSDNLSYLLPPQDATIQTALAHPTLAPNTAANAEPTVSREPAPFYTHQVESGDTLLSIGERYGVSIDYLLWNNPELTADPDLLTIGNELLVPGVEGIVYDVRLGDTVNGIASTYGIDPQTIIDYDFNELDSPDTIVEGLVLVLPGAVPPPPPEPVIAEPEPAAEPAPQPAPEPVGDPPAVTGPLPAGVVAPVPEPVIVPSIGYIWPVFGSLNSLYGPRWGSFHRGIDIGAPYGTGISAAGSGQVILATYRNNGYGNYVIVRHSDGSETLYAHLSSIGVSLGQYVNQGDYLGAVGCTGWCTGNHLHFEISIGGSPVDPLIYLP